MHGQGDHDLMEYLEIGGHSIKIKVGPEPLAEPEQPPEPIKGLDLWKVALLVAGAGLILLAVISLLSAYSQ